MKTIKLLLISTILFSCNQPKYEHVGQEIVDGKVSATKKGYSSSRGGSESPKIWVQTATTTKEVSIPFGYEGRWQVGDSCLLIIEKYKETEQ